MKYVLFILFSLIKLSTVAQADYIFHNGRIFTADKKSLWAEAIAIKADKIIAVGKNADILRLKNPQTKIINLQQQLVIPGINDAHDHVGTNFPARNFSIAKSITDPTPWQQIKDSIGSIVKEIPAGTFIFCTINPDLFLDASANRKSLDSIAPQHPVLLSAWTGHGKIMNSPALDFVGFNDQTVFAGGKLYKDASQHLNGVVEEYAGFEVPHRMNSKLEKEKIINDLEAFYIHAASLGITTVQNMCTELTAQQVMDIYQNHQFACRVRLIAFPFTNEKEVLLNDWEKDFRQLNKKNAVAGVKLIMDGTPVERLACLRQPYTDAPAQVGKLNFSFTQLKKYIEFSLDHQQQIIIHAVGDSTISTIIRAMRSLHPDAFWKDKRLRIEHGELAVLQSGDMNTLKQLGIVIVQNPTHLAIPQIVTPRFGTDRMNFIEPMRSLLDNNIPLALGSDGPNNPFLNMMLATFHPNNPNEAITLEEAVIAYTYGAAYAEFKEKEKGTLAKGMLADLCVLSQDIFSITPEQLPATQSLLTMVDGKIVYDAKGTGQLSIPFVRAANQKNREQVH